jgi:hypothetical protein
VNFGRNGFIKSTTGGTTLVIPLTSPTAEAPQVELDDDALQSLKQLRSHFDRMIQMRAEN